MTASIPMPKKFLAELIGTFWLVLGGCGSAVLAALFPYDNAAANPLGLGFLGVSLAFGLVTPPYGLCLMISCSIGGVRLGYVMKDVLLMLIPMFLVLMLVIVWPQVSLFLPGLISPEFLK